MIGFAQAMPILIAFIVSMGMTWHLSKGNWKLIPKDIPNRRSLHTAPVPRVGGIAVLLGMASAGCLLTFVDSLAFLLLIFAGLIPIVLVGLLDDWRDMSAKSRLLAQVIASSSLVIALNVEGGYYLADSNMGFLVGSILVFGTVWGINLFNFMDGMDGFAGAMSVSGFAVFSALGFVAAEMEYALISATIVAAVLGFLVFNWPKATIFLGDVGSTSLGFLAVAIGAWGVVLGVFPMWLPFLVFSPFWIDATVTLVKRVIRKENILQAHRQHYYQRLVMTGLGHKKTLLFEVVLMLLCSLSAVLGTFLSLFGQMIVVSIWVLVYVIILTAFPIFERHHSS